MNTKAVWTKKIKTLHRKTAHKYKSTSKYFANQFKDPTDNTNIKWLKYPNISNNKKADT